MRCIPVIALFAIISMAFPAAAQVHRCKDADGNLVYSDKPCASGQSGNLIERKKTREEIYREREQAYDAEQRKQERNFAQQQREALERSGREQQYQQAPTVRHSGNDWAARKALENSATSAKSISNNGGRWDREAEAQRTRELRERNRALEDAEARAQAEADLHKRPKPTHIQSCLGDHCRDNQGGSYTKSASDRNLLIGNDGQRCSRLDGAEQWRCN